MVDALVSGTSVSDDVKVRVLSWAQNKPLNRLIKRLLLFFKVY